MFSNTAQNTPHPLSAKLCLYILYFDFGKGEREGSEPEEKVRGSKIPT
jgi:hypothetical protein